MGRCADPQGDQAKGQTAMENCLQRSPDIGVVSADERGGEQGHDVGHGSSFGMSPP
jgi:hypothetical protein